MAEKVSGKWTAVKRAKLRLPDQVETIDTTRIALSGDEFDKVLREDKGVNIKLDHATPCFGAKKMLNHDRLVFIYMYTVYTYVGCMPPSNKCRLFLEI